MCGIVGYTGRRQALPLLVTGLQRLEYRGYDSAGVAINRGGKLAVYKARGKVKEVVVKLPKRVQGTVGIGHTRWATHGEPSDANAHPHTDASSRIAVVHNGIIENAKALKAQLQDVTFASETDTELLAHLIAAEAATTLVEAVRNVLKRVAGTYGLLVMDINHPDQVVAARNGSPVVLGIGENEMFVASDTAALAGHTRQVVYLEDGDIAELTPKGYSVTDLDAQPSSKQQALLAEQSEEASLAYEKQGYAHFMQKEIIEQPDALMRTLQGRTNIRFATARLDGLNLSSQDMLSIKRIKVLGCGSAYIAARLGARMIESVARIPADAEPAAEFRYRNPIIEADTLYIAVSQSGETYDTLAAVEEVQRKGGMVVGVVNAVGSSIARACPGGVYLHAGPEVAVVSTKTFLSTLVAFALIALRFGRTRDMAPADGQRLLDGLLTLPDLLTELMSREAEYAEFARALGQFDRAYFIGRNAGYEVAMEGALKLKEISYIHAEAYPASELKHGPLALICPETPTLAIVPNDDLFDKNCSSLEEIQARKGPLFAISQQPLPVATRGNLVIPQVHELLLPLVALVPLQFVAYHAALQRDRDIDQPRNLAKSVTVE